jgi:hypothetical protein
LPLPTDELRCFIYLGLKGLEAHDARLKTGSMHISLKMLYVFTLLIPWQ